MKWIELNSKRRHSRLLIALLSVCFVGVAGTLVWYYAQQRAEVEAAAIREMSSIGDIETLQIHNWRRERLSDARLVMSLPQMQAAERLLAGSGGADDRKQVRELIEALRREYGYSEVSLVHNDGQVAVRLQDRSPDSRIAQAQRAELAREAKEPTLSDIWVDRTGARVITLTAPVGGAGALIFEIDPAAFLDPYLKTWRSRNRTGETYLVRRDRDEVAYLTALRHGEGAALRRRSTKGWALPQEDKLPEAWVARGPDYRGAQVVIRVRRVPDSRWFLMVKLDRAEIAESLTRLAWEMGAALALIALAFTGGIGWIWKNQQLRLRQESEERLRSFANDTPAMLWLVSAGGASVFVNQGLREFAGGEAAEDWQERIHPEDLGRVRARLEECQSTRAPFSDEARVRRADGAYRWVLGQGIPRFAPDGEFLGYAGALLDITDRKEAEHKLQQANEELASGLAEKTAKEAEIRALSARLIHAQEEERRRLSRELHDDLSQQIAALSIGLENLKRAMPREDADVRLQCGRIQQRLIEVSESVRRMSHELHPAILQHSGLAAALRGFCREFEGLSGIWVDLRIVGEFGGVQPEVSLAVFRIVQEALRNVAKYAGVDRAEVELTHSTAGVTLMVADRGAGFRPNGKAKAGLGLVSMRERTRLVQGTVEIESAPGEGTRLTVRIPDTVEAAGVAS